VQAGRDKDATDEHAGNHFSQPGEEPRCCEE
jgi:hypothetical protein